MAFLPQQCDELVHDATGHPCEAVLGPLTHLSPGSYGPRVCGTGGGEVAGARGGGGGVWEQWEVQPHSREIPLPPPEATVEEESLTTRKPQGGSAGV